MTISKYAAALMQIIIAAVTAFVAIPAGQYTATTLTQLGILIGGNIAFYWVPLLDQKRGGWLKIAVTVLTAGATAALPFITSGRINPAEIGVVLLSILNAAAGVFGISIRKDADASALRASGR